MEKNIKDKLLGFLCLCDDMNDRLFPGEHGRLRTDVKNDLLAYFSFLVYSDNLLADNELDCIAYYFDEKFDEKELKSLYNGMQDELSVPMSITYFVKIDNDLFKENGMISSLTSEYIDIYKQLGMEIICSDRTLAMTEFKDYNDYISMLESYAGAYLTSMYE